MLAARFDPHPTCLVIIIETVRKEDGYLSGYLYDRPLTAAPPLQGDM